MVLGNFMTGGGFLNSRLAVRLRQKEGYSYGTGSQFQASSFEKSGAFLAYAIYAPQNGDKLEAAMKEEIQKVLDSGFTEQEVAEAKQGWLQQRQVSRGVDRELARTLATRDYLGRTLAWDADLESRVGKLTGAEIQAAMKKHIGVGEMTFIQSGDFAKAAKAGG
jgi:zinc protease